LDPKLNGAFAHQGHPLALAGWRHKHEARRACGCGLGAGGLEVWNAGAAACWNRLRTSLGRSGGLEFVRVVEVQKRGALHLHVVVRSDRPLDVLDVQGWALAAGFGCSISLDQMAPDRVSRYMAKYAVKGYTERAAVPWRDVVLDKDTGEMRVRQMAAYRTVSQSAGWGMTVRQIKAEIKASRDRAAALYPPPAPDGAGPREPEPSVVLAGVPPDG
jgi:hypothetical protein